MKTIVCLNGGTATQSYNKALTRYIANRYATTVTWVEPVLTALPFIVASQTTGTPAAVTTLVKQVSQADAVVIATPEYNNGPTAALKNALDWCSYAPYPLHEKPLLLMGAATGTLGTVRAQLMVRTILQSAALAPRLVDTPEILVGQAGTKFDSQGNLMDQTTVGLIDQGMQRLFQLMERGND
ncbi:NADPH-dependent FMN reductase [Furfurilactobacillus sp. WILCCON 0119]